MRRRRRSSWAIPGSLGLGGLLGVIAVATKHEIVLAIVGGLFVLEALSVIIQVAVFKRTGKRVFLMAPIHHHFEKLGWTEPQVVIRFWIISVVLALAGLWPHSNCAEPMTPVTVIAKGRRRRAVRPRWLWACDGTRAEGRRRARSLAWDDKAESLAQQGRRRPASRIVGSADTADWSQHATVLCCRLACR